METKRVIIYIAFLSTCAVIAATVPDRSTSALGTIKYVTRTEYWTGEVTVCDWIQCHPGTYVEKCVKNSTMDRCQPCPSGSYLNDTTTSDNVLVCRELPSCSKDDNTIDSEEYHFCAGGSPIKCQCDTKRGYCGDPCACSKKNCQSGENLFDNCTCVGRAQTLPPTTTEKEVLVTTIDVESLTTENGKEASVTPLPLTLSTTSTTTEGPDSTQTDGCKQTAPVNEGQICMSVGIFIGVLIAAVLTPIVIGLAAAAIYKNRTKICKINDDRRQRNQYSSPPDQNSS
ncbi:tumor necrosis factor receptor superfamily member 21-like [Pecten maximus]|uniref:tumor necrosis factor receptor superfamily member 21-like n=1 Tax=Pecten maximus TaxID=6579 RepID=UPI0014586565|nr:tumor necrosis factor receptor superfamily member 21-like [Pecten maximus]